MFPQIRYENPRPKPELKDCAIYHSIDLPGESLTGDWDLRQKLREYTVDMDFKGKTVLDIGAATGLLSFYAESQGAASVTSFDAEPDCCFPIPWVENDPDVIAAGIEAHLQRVKNGYWYCWNALGSKAKVLYGDLHDLDHDTIGRFDIVLAGCILLHLSDPFGALIQIADLCADKLVVCEIEPKFTDNPILFPNLVSTGNRDPRDLMSWWALPAKTLSRLLDVIGFKTERIIRFELVSPSAGGQTGHFYSLLASRK